MMKPLLPYRRCWLVDEQAASPLTGVLATTTGVLATTTGVLALLGPVRRECPIPFITVQESLARATCRCRDRVLHQGRHRADTPLYAV